jgi:hypothetical protein
VSLLRETSLVRVRRKPSRLFFPTLVLASVAFGLAFFADQISPETMQLGYLLGGIAVGLFWLLPLLSYLFGYLELTNQRVICRFGFLGLRKREVDYRDVSSIEIIRPKALSGKVISLVQVDESQLLISGYARTKLLAAEIERLARESL